MERNQRKVYTGKVVSDKMDKTITVVVDTYKKSPLYRKSVKVSKKFHVHDEEGLAGIGDTVTIMETRPLSKTKRFRLLEVVAKSDLV
ncbi:30S ribosomal protein S17 [Peloplasma aerotolerans]|jgi:small subunit ribosomal protein S17|uniref:Small ribosomal subunit protein uS17 n=1 Tax=Peloplasma aerotolerans TaxID=3044389 RepID=A0AAW6U961_9MOLU|nr:30S ribosomal protein S17 [Mariniplasma sp. M4Ah]MCR3905926.1 30S ribosomal protein S17 [Mycoplasmatota bacterium]MDI6453445.1 30S ribosomal protein S17 [Mariniplasma sp. M4Ah]